MRRAAKVDANHAEIVEALRKLPCEVLSLAQLGNGTPDLLALFRGRLVLLEVKKPGEKQNAAQLAFAGRWPVSVVRSGPEAVLAVVEAAKPCEAARPCACGGRAG
jgi:hypothetical protein